MYVSIYPARLPQLKGGDPHSILAKVLDCDVLVNEFDHSSTIIVI